MYILMVGFKVHPGKIGEFIQASIADARGSVTNEPGCRRFDIIQDGDDLAKFAFTEIYNGETDFEFHKTTSHFKVWDEKAKPLLSEPPTVSVCRPVFPLDDANWSSHRPNAVDDDYFLNGSLHVIHAARNIKPEHVDAFIKAVSLDAIGSTGQEPGCLRFDVYQNTNNPSEIYLYEVYANAAAFEYHKGTPHIRKWQETVKDMYGEQHPARVVGKNIWPADNWKWSSGNPVS